MGCGCPKLPGVSFEGHFRRGVQLGEQSEAPVGLGKRDISGENSRLPESAPPVLGLPEIPGWD